jgi:hypothetical protein
VNMITIIKLDPTGVEQTRYKGTLLEYLADGVVVGATWVRPDRELGYTRFETGDQFVEYFYGDRWFNIFAVASREGVFKGWYCNIAEPACISADVVTQVDLYLDVWINPVGEALVLDEDEFEATTFLSERQRSGAKRGLRELLGMLEGRREVFAQVCEGVRDVCGQVRDAAPTDVGGGLELGHDGFADSA